MLQKAIDIVGFTETNLNWTNTTCTNNLRRAFTRRFKTYISHTPPLTSHSNLSHTLNHQPCIYQPRSSAMIVTGKYIGCVETSNSLPALGSLSTISL
jgi:hypothetical protein